MTEPTLEGFRASDAKEAVTEMRRVARRLLSTPNRDCSIVRQAIYWNAKADRLTARLRSSEVR